MPYDFSRHDAVLLDLDGTIYHSDHPLPGAVELLHRLRAEGRIFACLSNTTHSPRDVADRLGRFGIDAVDTEHVYTAAYAATIHVLETCGARPRVFNLATQGVQDMLEGKVHWVQRGDEPCDAVIVGAPASKYASLDRQSVALHLLREGARLVGTSADRVYPTPHGLEIGSGAFTSMYAYATNVKPFFSGKPQPEFFHTLCRRLGVEPGRCVLIGDNLETDILGANQLGMTSILTLTGITRRQDLGNLPESMRPDLVVNDLTEL